MKFLNKMERKYGRYAIKNLTTYIILTYVIGFVLTSVAPNVLGYFLLEPYFILRGEAWRVVSWVLLPPMTLDIWALVMLFFYYSIGRQLERAWGDFRYNVYIFGGILFIVISSFILYFITGAQVPFAMFGESFSTYYICLSLFFGYAMTNPNQMILLYFIIPIKIKWMALVSVVYILFDLIRGSALTRTEIIAALINFLIFFGLSRGFKAFIPRGLKRTTKRRQPIIRPAPTVTNSSGVSRHKCAVCGKTEKDGDDLEFRYCSKCEGDYEYCQEHLFTHGHIRKDGGE